MKEYILDYEVGGALVKFRVLLPNGETYFDEHFVNFRRDAGKIKWYYFQETSISFRKKTGTYMNEAIVRDIRFKQAYKQRSILGLDKCPFGTEIEVFEIGKIDVVEKVGHWE